jgi:hypothetical protein
VFKSRLDEIWKVLVAHCDSAEEGNRNIAAECLGKLCLIDSEKFLPKLLVRYHISYLLETLIAYF